jgi:molecular chaperone GrpE
MNNNPDENTQISPASEADAAADPSGADEAGDALDLPAQLKRAEAEAGELRDAWLRAKAETDNARRLAQNDVAKAHKYAVERFAQELLAVKDALELTLATPNAKTEALQDGVALTLRNLEAAFDKANIVEINPMHEKYDPHRHQAMTMIESEQPPGTVVQVFQRGYLLNDRVLRPALVAVAKSAENPA